MGRRSRSGCGFRPSEYDVLAGADPQEANVMRDTDAAQSFTRFVALGDSQTEGIGDPDGHGGHVGWADRLALRLAGVNPRLGYANLAIRGRRAGQIREEQLGPALALAPDLAAVVAGMNDLIRPRYDQESVLAEIEAMITALTAAGARVITFTFPDIGGIAPVVRPLSARVRAMNERIRELARRPGVVLVDFEPVRAATDRRVWAEDRLHLNPLGHDLVARATAETLRLPGADGAWRLPLPPHQRTMADAVAAELRWAALHMVPWMVRRARGISRGDGVTAKRPGLLPVVSGTD
ncbi:SGNH/GDSL hydrolase family protein [Nocardia sp. CDC159]|uniref:SGNH/GDSL hydrolase family protein n=1 Tax=Nocardia pulmonis TaxID=2951408 RepID=A0A9X2EBX9_9NOCA|nr:MULTISPECIES: SGNH/GDSL hydrolase family protein [Nocardia]MCM6775348.1 SGNH/GDSL hydrolase family protein [Nocardia pulmonis]MCM6787918.1 SGNH/GDSL hydrolase family protein [Nocardia sp. CDC159]